MAIAEALLPEFDHEMAVTRRLLERVPEDKFEWKPHPKSMSLGELAMHVAMVPDVICGWACVDEKVFTGGDNTPMPKTTTDLTSAPKRARQR